MLFTTLLLLFVVNARVVADDSCQDSDIEACKEMAVSIPNMCSNDCLASHCKKSCGKCSLTCYECHEVDHPANCTNRVVCPSSDHYCYAMQTFTDDLRQTYRLGCALNSHCATAFYDAPIIGRRSDRSVSTLSGGCCLNHLCNNKSPSTMAAVAVPSSSVPTSPDPLVNHPASCQDIPGDTCLLLSLSLSDMCQSNCLASKVCPGTCGYCVECFTCPFTLNPENCTQTTVCQPGQECFVGTSRSTSFGDGYVFGCIDRNNCLAEVGANNTNIQNVCCDSDRCNHHMVRPTVHQPSSTFTTTTTTQPTTTKPTTSTTSAPLQWTTPQFQSPNATAVKHCPAGYVNYNNNCYKYIIGPPSDWLKAMIHCQLISAQLATFTEFHPVDEIINLIEQYTHLQVFQFYVGASRILGQWRWLPSGKVVKNEIATEAGKCLSLHNTPWFNIMSGVPCNEHHPPLCVQRLN